MSDEKTKNLDGNQGEGNRGAAEVYNEETKKFVKSGKVEESAADAKKAVEGGEKAELDAAEKAGRERAKEMDPNVHRDR